MITMKDIILEGHPTLRKKADKVDLPASPEVRQLAKDMQEFLVNSQDEKIAEKYGLRAGVGIAAPQLNESLAMTAVLIPGFEEGDEPELEGIFVNPRILSHSVEEVCLREGEGCLSVDRDVPGYVPRSARIKVRYYDLDGNEYVKRFKGYPAIVLQHEIDHLNGILFYDHINEKEPWSLDDHQYLLGEED
ncbi:peptide deformylase [Aerococcus urinaehominis]|uniref:Peptide deformylase n=1 Tax=Aerococcus urinaehominis TaxID=128944 RepID=A0A0X8FKJ1_9LACT|nr:peptide deformylase [Aerococcus urinaehominis]AMB99016.1 peptide deformylase [Aerococcus urinaehominis]SDM56884.1 peptide deformylase [Aerococcus urinaehominis]